jgi:hypothetical protein
VGAAGSSSNSDSDSEEATRPAMTIRRSALRRGDCSWLWWRVAEVHSARLGSGDWIEI